MAKKIRKKNNNNWAKTAVKKPGAFRSWCRKQGYSKVNTRCIQKGLKSKNPTTRKRARLALTFKKMRAKRKTRRK